MERENVLIPQADLDRQREFEEKIRGLFAAREAHPAACVDTFGCQQNVADGQKLMGMLEASGFTLTQDPKEADLVLLNTCAIREHAEDRVFGNLGALTHTKKENPEQVICLCGCMAQEPRVSERIKKSYPHVDLVFGPQALWKFPELLWQVYETKKRVFSVQDEHGTIAEGIPVVREKGVKAWVSIMYGCNNFCSYCIVPYVRGREKSRSFEQIVDEVTGLVRAGVREITLLGQNVNSYGRDSFGSPRFAELLRAVGETGVERIFFTSSHPKDLLPETIDAMAEVPSVMPQLHLAVQSGSNRILKLMNRKYTREHYLDLIDRVRDRIPDIALSTDIIVGFPGETEEDFEQTISLAQEARYAQAFTFIYSKRAGTPAAEMPDDTPREVILERFNRLVKVVESTAYDFNQKDLHTKVPMLIEGTSKKDPGMLQGKSHKNQTVHAPVPAGVNPADLLGRIVDVEVDTAKTWYLSGSIVGDMR